MSLTPGHVNTKSAWLVLAARVFLLLAALALAVAGFTLARSETSGDGKTTEGYVCPMHPEVQSKTPGTCPICKMDLEPTRSVKPSMAEHSETEHSETEHNETEHSARPIAPKYASGVPWLPETYPPVHTGSSRKRAPLGSVKRRVFVDDVRAAAWLETPEQVVAVLYRDELVGLSPGERGTFLRAAAPRSDGVVVRLSDEPPRAWDDSTALVRLVVESARNGAPSDPSPELHQGQVGWLELPDRSRELLVFPESALLRSNEGPFVLVPDTQAQQLVRRPVEIGRTLNGHVVVLSGLREGDPLLIGDAFFLNHEARFEPPPGPVAGVAP